MRFFSSYNIENTICAPNIKILPSVNTVVLGKSSQYYIILHNPEIGVRLIIALYVRPKSPATLKPISSSQISLERVSQISLQREVAVA